MKFQVNLVSEKKMFHYHKITYCSLALLTYGKIARTAGCWSNAFSILSEINFVFLTCNYHHQIFLIKLEIYV